MENAPDAGRPDAQPVGDEVSETPAKSPGRDPDHRQKTTGDFRFTDLGVKLVSAVAAGVGVLGFVTLVGGAILHAQLSAAGLPSDQAVSAIPRSTLLVVGARLLVPLLAVVGLFLSLLWLLERTLKLPSVGCRAQSLAFPGS